MKFQWYYKPLYKQKTIPGVLLIPIDLDVI